VCRTDETADTMYPECRKYIGVDGNLCCKLAKALHGCVQALKLWYEKLKVGFQEEKFLICSAYHGVQGNMWLGLAGLHCIFFLSNYKLHMHSFCKMP